jgi:hypothetical protein
MMSAGASVARVHERAVAVCQAEVWHFKCAQSVASTTLSASKRPCLISHFGPPHTTSLDPRRSTIGQYFCVFCIVGCTTHRYLTGIYDALCDPSVHASTKENALSYLALLVRAAVAGRQQSVQVAGLVATCAEPFVSVSFPRPAPIFHCSCRECRLYSPLLFLAHVGGSDWTACGRSLAGGPVRPNGQQARQQLCDGLLRPHNECAARRGACACACHVQEDSSACSAIFCFMMAVVCASVMGL